MGIPLWSGQDGPHKRVGGQHRGFTLPALLWLQGDTYVTEDVESLRKTVRDLLAKLQEAEQQHQADRVAFEVRCGLWGEGAPGDWAAGCGYRRLSPSGLHVFLAGATNWERLGLEAWATSACFSLS